MRKLLPVFLAGLLIFAAQIGCRAPRVEPSPAEAARWSVYFSPNGGGTRAIVSRIEKSRRSILVQAYSFTSASIAYALVQAHRRGVEVRVILDKSNETEHYSAADYLTHSGIPTLIDSAHSIAHNKVMILDHKTVITGSFNFTRSAEERNAENLLIIDDPALASRYEQNWKFHASHSRPLF